MLCGIYKYPAFSIFCTVLTRELAGQAAAEPMLIHVTVLSVTDVCWPFVQLGADAPLVPATVH
jgi:hypothetical protein